MKEVAAAAKKALAEGNEDAEVYEHLASALTDLGRFDEAEECCRKGLARFPKGAEFHNGMGLIKRRTGEPGAAISYYDEAIRCHEEAGGDERTSALIRNNKGAALVDLKKYGDALECFDAAIEADPDCKSACVNKYRTLLFSSRKDEADAFLDELIGRGQDLSELRDEFETYLEGMKSVTGGRRWGARMRGSEG